MFGDTSAGAEGMTSVLAHHQSVAEARLRRLEAIADLDRRRDYHYDGYSSTTAFLIHRCGMTARDARREVFLARSLEEMPYAVKSVEACRLTLTQFEILAHTRRRHPDPYRADEAALVEAVAPHTARETRQLADYWCQSHDETRGADDEPPGRVFLSTTFQRRGRLDGDLDPLTHDLVNTALEALMGEIVRDTPREELASASQRRAEALAELARRFLDSPDAPTDHGVRPHVTVLVDWNTLTGDEPGGMCELGDGSPITPAQARQLACDANLCRLLTGPAGEILDLGRSQRTVSPAQWKVLRARDRHCRWWGCRRPASWCDAHHIRHWTEHKGSTDLDNLILLCRYHHTLIHRHGWKLEGNAGAITIIRPDGTNLPNAPPWKRSLNRAGVRQFRRASAPVR